MKIIKIFLLGIIIWGWVGKNTVLAQEQETPTSLGISPAIVEMVLTPGMTETRSVKVFNVSNKPMPIKSIVRDFVGSGDDGQEITEAVSAKTWIQIDPADFILDPGMSKEIMIMITPPIEATPGGHYASIFFNPVLPIDSFNNDKPKVVPRVAVQLLFLVKGEMQEKIKLESIRVNRSWWWGGKIEVEMVLANSGNVHLLPKIELLSVNMADPKIRMVWKVENRVLLPGENRKLKISEDMPKKWGQYKVEGEINYGTFGEKIKLPVQYFWILPPFWMIFAGMFLLTLLAILIKMKYRHV